MRKRLTENQKAYIIENKDKIAISQMSKHLSKSYYTIQGFLLRNKLSYFRGKKNYTDSYLLTKREIELIKYFAYTVSEIAEKLIISEHTVRSHINNVLTKMRVNTRIMALILALKEGIINLEDVQLTTDVN